MNKTWVLDASVAAKWYLDDEEDVPHALSILASFREARARVVAPAIIRYELGNTLELARRRGRITAEYAWLRFSEFLQTGVHIETDSDELVLAAQEIAMRLAVEQYDAVYLALAQQVGGELITADRPLFQRAREEDFPVAWISEANLGD